MKRYASKAQQIVLAAAVFDKHGRVLVNPDGLLPCEKITDSFLEKTPQHSFTVAHPLFHWMFQVSRNWSSITGIISGISTHLSHLPRNGRDSSRGGIKLISDHGELIDNYNVIFRELFCAAAAALADKMKTPLASVGILWDEILPTGAGSRGAQARARQRQQEADYAMHSPVYGNTFPTAGNATSSEDLAEKGVLGQSYHDLGRGSLMFLVRRVENARDVESLTAAGYRFAELHQVSGIIGSTMQIKTQSIEHKMSLMSVYAKADDMLEPGVHVALFGVRARVNDAYGFDVLTRRDARNLLPSVKMPLLRMDACHMDLLRQFKGMTPLHITKELEGRKSLSPQETRFAMELKDSIWALDERIKNSIFNEAVLCSKTVEVPCRPVSPGSLPGTCTMIAFKIVIPIHMHIDSPTCEFVPLNLFKVHQLVYKELPSHLAFTRSVHRELAPIIKAVPMVRRANRPTGRVALRSRHIPLRNARLTSRLFRMSRSHTPGCQGNGAVDAYGNPIPTVLSGAHLGAGSGRSSSKLKLWSSRASNGGDASSRIGSVDSASDRYPHNLNSHHHHNNHHLHHHLYTSPSPPPTCGMEDIQSHTSPHAPAPLPSQPPLASLGGIMVSKEITVDVQKAGDVSDMDAVEGYSPVGMMAHNHQITLLQQRRASQGGPGDVFGEVPAMTMDGRRMTGLATAAASYAGGRPTTSIEMRPLATDRSSVHMGAAVQVANVEAEKLTESPTFVDELFRLCVESR